MAEIHLNELRVHEGEDVDLDKRPTRTEPVYESKKDYKRLLKRDVKELSKLQYKLYSADKHALLVIFQAMDTAGKDGAIKHVMSGVNPQGTQVYSFKHPSQNELQHDFLWRTTQCLPERGRIGIFNRSYYEEVLIARVHPEILRAESLPDDHIDDPDLWKHRYESINDQERHLHRNGTRIVKFFLHISREEQRQRLLARIDSPDKNWKFGMDDVKERQHWDAYMKAYRHALEATSTDDSPWYVIPADDKKNARLMVAKVISETLRQLDPKIPDVSDEQRAELQKVRTILENETLG
jgi:PPK2 family polyphosphate:nucleotide phosphotransferase